MFRCKVVNPNHQHVFVVRAVEDRDTAMPGNLFVDTPEEIVRQFLGGRLLEAVNRAALRVHRPDHMPAHAVLSGRIDALQDDQQSMLAFGIEQLLQKR